MADQDDTLDPEPVDAEFEPADDTRPSGKRTRNNLFGALSLIVIAGLAAGAVWLGMRDGVDMAGPATDTGSGAQAELAAQAAIIDRLEARLVALENAGTAPDPALDRLAAIEQRLDAAEARPADPAGTSALQDRLAALEEREPTPPAGPDETLVARLDALDETVRRLDALANQALDEAQAADTPGTDPQILQDFGDRLSALESAGPAEPAAVSGAAKKKQSRK